MTSTQSQAKAKIVLPLWLLVLSLKKDPAKCAKVCGKSVVILIIPMVYLLLLAILNEMNNGPLRAYEC